jgi:hypothetical protein
VGNLMLSHSSLEEFLGEHDTQTLLLELAGEDFQMVEAIVVGRMAGLVYMIETNIGDDRRSILFVQNEILHSIEMTEASTGLTQTKLLSIFDELLDRHSRSLAGPLTAHWDPLYDDHIDEQMKVTKRNGPKDTFYWEFRRRPRGVSDHCSDESDLLPISISLGLSCYLKYKISTRGGVPPKTGTPLLFYPLWTFSKTRAWVERVEGHLIGLHFQEDRHEDLVRLLLAAGADPNECFHGFTPWFVVLHRLCTGYDGDFPLYRVGPPDAIIQQRKSFLDKLEVARLMLEHGANPFLRMYTPDFIISPKIFAELLERECCSGDAFRDCVCAYAMQIKPRLTELVKLVEERRYLKQQMRTDGELILVGAWLAAVLAYILQSCFTSSF